MTRGDCSAPPLNQTTSVAGTEVDHLPPNRRPGIQRHRRRPSILERRIYTLRSVGERATGQDRSVAISPVGRNLLVDRSVVRERRRRKPQIEVSLRVGTRGVESADARRRQVAAQTRNQSLSIAAKG